MSKKIFYFMMLAFSLSLFTACSDDDDDDNNVTDYAVDTQGTYTGTLNLTFPEQDPFPFENKNIALKRTGVNKVEVSLDEITIPGEVPITVKNIVVKDIPVTKNGDTYTLTEVKDQKVSVNVGAPVDVKVTVSGTVKSNKLEMKINVGDIPVIGEIPITFSGDKKNK